MHEPTKPTILEMMALPPETITSGDISKFREVVLAGAVLMEECQFYQDVLGWEDPRAAHDAVVARADHLDYMFDRVRAAVLEQLVRKMESCGRGIRQWDTGPADVRDLYGEVQEEVAAYVEIDRMRESAFRRDPGRFLPGARNCGSVSLLYPGGAWVIEREGDPYPWLVTHATLRYAQSDFDEAYDIAERNGRFHVLVIGAPGLKQRLVLPSLAPMAEINIEVLEIDVATSTGPSAPVGGRVA